MSLGRPLELYCLANTHLRLLLPVVSEYVFSMGQHEFFHSCFYFMREMQFISQFILIPGA